MARLKQFSVVLPTYSGQKTIARTFDSLLAQNVAQLKYEVVVVIDGPSEPIRQIVKSYEPRFKANKIGFTVEQFRQNRGRFEARVAGAKLANYNQLLFLEDRVYLDPGYFKRMAKIDTELALGNVLEDKTNSNLIADTLTLVRRAVYGSQWGQDFKDYDINTANFERAPKGMASLWVSKSLFLEACQEFKKTVVNSKDSSDDTGVLRLIIEKGTPIRRISGLKLYYMPRTGLLESVKHLYQRGPKFVDYYLKPGTRFFAALAGFYALLAVVLVGLILITSWMIYLLALALVLILIFCLVVTKKLIAGLKFFVGIIAVGLIFAAGLLRGSLQKIIRT